VTGEISRHVAKKTPHTRHATRHRALLNAGDAQRKMVEGAALFHPTCFAYDFSTLDMMTLK
jgi:hypothetical protein